MLGKGTACNEGCNAAKGKPQLSIAVCGQTNLKMAKIYPLFTEQHKSNVFFCFSWGFINGISLFCPFCSRNITVKIFYVQCL
jgi:hypothetical protein